MALRKEGDEDPITVEVDLGTGTDDADLTLLTNPVGYVRRRATSAVVINGVACDLDLPNLIQIPVVTADLVAGDYDIEIAGTWSDTETDVRFPTRGYYELIVEPKIA